MTASTNPQAKLKVFLVEDNADTRFLLRFLLEEAGYEVREASTVQAALNGYLQWQGDVLISDIGLPDGSGCELMQQLRAAGASPYGIAMSGYGTASDAAASSAAGFSHHLVKPIEVETLQRLLEAVREQIGRAEHKP